MAKKFSDFALKSGKSLASTATKLAQQTPKAPLQQAVTHTRAAELAVQQAARPVLRKTASAPAFFRARQQPPLARGGSLFTSRAMPRDYGSDRGMLGLNLVQKRTHMTVAQGSGRAAEERSTVSRLADYQTKGKSIIGGPGADPAHDSWWDRFVRGASQEPSSQHERIKDHLRALCEAHDNGDMSIHINGHSRGAGNAKLLADYLYHEGLVHPDTGKVYRRPGKELTREEWEGGPAPEGKLPAAIVESLNLVDTVPEMGEGHMTVYNENGFQNVPYEHKDAQIQYNTRHVNNIEAGAEERWRFRPLPIIAARHPVEGFGAQVNTGIAQNSLHSDVGGARGFNKDAGDVSTFWLANNLHHQMPDKFRALTSDEIRQYNAALARLDKHTASPGIVERLIGLATGTQKRKFTKDAKPLEPIEDPRELALLEKEHARIGDKN